MAITDEALMKLSREMQAFAKSLNIVVVTATQHPRPPGYRVYRPPPEPGKNEIVFIDYITKLQ